MTRVCLAAGGVNLSQGFPDFGSPAEIKEAAVASIREERNQYPITYGEPNLREAVARKAERYNGIRRDPDTEITVTCGATEAMMATLMAIINEGDEIVVFEPFYENYGPDGILSGAVPRYVTLTPPDWEFKPVELAAAFNEKTKAIIINTPNNPTGKVFTRGELETIAQLCEKWDCYVITDEIYEHILYDGAVHISPASIPELAERTITLNSISKTYAVTGWRVGWAIAEERITREIRKVHDFLTVGAPTPFQHAAAVALDFPDNYYQRVQDHYTNARAFLINTLQETGFEPVLPRGSYYIITDVSKWMARLNIPDDFTFARRLIELSGVATVPGSSFYANREKGKTQIRFSFCKKQETLAAVDERLRRFHAEYGAP